MALFGIGKRTYRERELEYQKQLEVIKSKYSVLQENMKFGQQLAQIGSWTRDLITDEIMLTDEVYEILEISRDEFSGSLDDYYQFIHHDDLYNVQRATQEAVFGKPYDIEYGIITKNGKTKYVHENTKVILDNQDQPMKMIGIIQNITKHKLMIKDLKVISDQLSQVHKIAGIYSWKYDTINDVFTGSVELCKIFDPDYNKSPKDLESFISLIHKEDQVLAYEAYRMHLDGQSCSLDIRIPQDDQTIIYLQSKSDSIYDEEKRMIGIVGTVQDISESKKLEFELKKSVLMMTQAQALTNVGSWEMNFEKKSVHWSREAYKIFGYSNTAELITFEKFLNVVHPEDLPIIENILVSLPKGPTEVEFRVVRPDGSVRDAYEIVEFEYDDEEKPLMIYGSVQDITTKKHHQKKLDEERDKSSKIQKRYNMLIKESQDVFEIIDEEGRLKYISDASEKVIGYKPDERLGKHIYNYYDSDEANKLKEMVKTVLENPDSSVCKDIRIKTKKGNIITIEVYMKNFLNDSSIDGIIINFRDVTHRIDIENQIRHISNHDWLTGLPNKLCFEKDMQTICMKALRTRDKHSLLLLDIDNYIFVKNMLGYKYAELYIVQIAVKLKKILRSKYKLYRHSDNRFAIIVDSILPSDDMEDFVQNLVELFKSQIITETYALDTVISIGIRIFSNDIINYEQMINDTETALFLAKSDGRKKYRFYSESMNISTFRQFTLTNDLRHSVDRGQLAIEYQPIIKIRTDEIIGVEALVRWHHPEWGVISPGEFITMAEESGFISEIGNWVLNEVCKTYILLSEQGFGSIYISINASSIQFMEEHFVENVISTIKSYALQPDFLLIELTENTLLSNTEKLKLDFIQLKENGIKIALDDFGKGYSSFAYLTEFNFDILKLDALFVKEIDTNKASKVLIRHLIDIAHDLDISLVAEGIENWNQLDYLRENRCYAGQGYLYSRPVAESIIIQLLRKKKCHPIKIKDSDFIVERRKYYRIKFNQSLEAKVTILEIKGRQVNVGNTKVLIQDIGPGGHSFISNVKLPVDKDVILQFRSTLLNEEIRMHGYSVWSMELDNGLYKYGVKYTIDENLRADIIRVLNKVQINVKRDIMFADGNFISGSIEKYFRLI